MDPRYTGLWPHYKSLWMKFFYIRKKPWSWNPSRNYTTSYSILSPEGWLDPTYGCYRLASRKIFIQWLWECSKEERCCQTCTICEITFYFIFEIGSYDSQVCLKLPLQLRMMLNYSDSSVSNSQVVGLLLYTPTPRLLLP